MQLIRIFIVVSLLVAQLAGNPACAEIPAFINNIDVGGYSSVRAQKNRGGNAEAAINEVSLIVKWDDQDRWRFFAEIEVEEPLSWHEGKGVSTRNAALDLERFYADYTFTDQLNIRAGRYLTPVSRWNLLHAAPLVWTTTRPVSTYRLFPMALNGVMMHGIKPWGDATFEYAAFAETLQDQQEDRHEIRYKNAFGLRGLYSGSVDASISYMEFDEDDLLKRQYRMVGLDFFKSHDGWELSGEAFYRRTKDLGESSGGAYLQGVAPLGKKWFGIARVESFKASMQENKKRYVLGLAWRYRDNQIFKIEYAGGHQEGIYIPSGLFTSVAILF